MTGSGERLGVVVVGCGLIGARRAEQAALHPRTRVVALVDPVAARARTLAERHGGQVLEDWRAAVKSAEADVVVVATPNKFLAEIGCVALAAGRHVLLEKPMGRTLEESRRLAAAASGSAGLLKIGFNHRYHPAVAELLQRVRAGEIGRILNVRGRYGHGGRPGIEREWRGDPELAGGGHLLDQGVHMADLVGALLGAPARVYGTLQTAFWPLGMLEDNGFGLFHYGDGAVAQFHVSMTQWKNLFSLEVFGETGALLVEGLGGSYGLERLVHWRRRAGGGAPDQAEWRFEGPDGSWTAEWADFVAAVDGAPLGSGGPEEGLAAMRVIDALYRSAALGAAVEL